MLGLLYIYHMYIHCRYHIVCSTYTTDIPYSVTYVYIYIFDGGVISFANPSMHAIVQLWDFLYAVFVCVAVVKYVTTTDAVGYSREYCIYT